jgi:hypothetical protein
MSACCRKTRHGRTHELTITGLDVGKDFHVKVRGFKNGTLVREEVHETIGNDLMAMWDACPWG